LPSWNDGPAKQSIVKFVQAVADSASPQHVPPAARMAVFDNDGTLWSEQPMYFQGFFAFDRVRALAPKHPEWKTQQPFKGILENDMKAVAAAGEKELFEVIAATHTGITTDEFAQIVKDWVAQAKHPKFQRPYTDLVYQPMLELLAYLRASGFKTFIVSGGGVEFMRVFAEQVYGIPPEQVVGSVGETKLEVRNGKPVLLKLPKINLVDDKGGQTGWDQPVHRAPAGACLRQLGRGRADAAVDGGGRRAPVHGPSPSHRRRAGMGLRPELPDRASRQSPGRGDAEGLDGRGHEAGLEGDLPVPEVRRPPRREEAMSQTLRASPTRVRSRSRTISDSSGSGTAREGRCQHSVAPRQLWAQRSGRTPAAPVRGGRTRPVQYGSARLREGNGDEQ
jgi:phosphoglycolate phosphatase-like HAD superfamily hydrolase